MRLAGTTNQRSPVLAVQERKPGIRAGIVLVPETWWTEKRLPCILFFLRFDRSLFARRSFRGETHTPALVPAARPRRGLTQKTGFPALVGHAMGPLMRMMHFAIRSVGLAGGISQPAGPSCETARCPSTSCPEPPWSLPDMFRHSRSVPQSFLWVNCAVLT